MPVIIFCLIFDSL